MIKDCLSHILPTLTGLVNLSFASSIFPRAWKRSEVVPHLKDGDHDVPNNNRPISLLPVLSKVTEKIALSQFDSYLTQQGKLTDHQSGNRKYHSTETLSLAVTDHIFKAMDERKLTAMVLIDLSKAFDSICHETLLLKLRGLGASSQAHRWFESYLTDRRQSTRLGISLSEELPITHGVPQGSILGSLLFDLYMNDLPSVVRTCSIELYVDDTKVYLSFSSKDIDTCLANITEELHLIASWCCSNHLLINPSKTKLIVFGTRQLLSRAPDIKVPFLCQELVPVPAVKYLAGIILDSSLTFNNHVNSLTSSLISTLCQISRVRHLFSEPVLLTMLNALVFSKLFYCSTVWAGTFQQNLQKLQLVQNFAARVLTGTKMFHHISPVLYKLGWLSIK